MRNPCENFTEREKNPSTLLKPISTGEEKCNPGHFWGPGVRNTYIIHYVISGKGIFYCGTNKYEVGPGQIFVIFPDTVIKYQADEKDPWHYIWVVFKGDEAKDIFKKLNITLKKPICHIQNKNQILSLLRSMPEERSMDLHENLMFSSMLYELAANLLTDSNTVDSKGENQYFSAAVNYIRAHYSEDLTVDNVAAYIGISRKYLFALFKKAIGVSPKEYIVDYRMKKACALLQNNVLSVGNVAYSVGYKDQLTFSRMFKEKMGCSPTQYKESNK